MKVYEVKYRNYYKSGKKKGQTRTTAHEITLNGKREMDKFIVDEWFFGTVNTDESEVTVTDTKTGKIEHKTLNEIIREN